MQVPFSCIFRIIQENMKDIKVHEEIKEICRKAALWIAVFLLVFAIELNLSVSQGLTERDFTVNGDSLNPISIKLNEEGIPITSIDINLNERISNSQLNIKLFDPSQLLTLNKSAEPVYSYFVIEHNIPAEMISSALISFMIEDSWISSRNLLSNEITLQSNAGGEWRKIPANQAGFSNGFRVYTAALTSGELSAEIAITASRTVEQQRAMIVHYRQPTQINFPRPEPAATESAFSTLFRGSDFGAGEIILALVIIILTSGIVAVTRMFHSIHIRHELESIERVKEDLSAKAGEGEEEQVVKLASAKESVKKEPEQTAASQQTKSGNGSFSKIIQYAKNQLEKGVEKARIESMLLKKGWPKEVISHIFTRLRSLNKKNK